MPGRPCWPSFGCYSCRPPRSHGCFAGSMYVSCTTAACGPPVCHPCQQNHGGRFSDCVDCRTSNSATSSGQFRGLNQGSIPPSPPERAVTFWYLSRVRSALPHGVDTGQIKNSLLTHVLMFPRTGIRHSDEKKKRKIHLARNKPAFFRPDINKRLHLVPF